MRKFTFSFKSLLVACGLLLGSANAWADVVYSWEGAEGTAKESGGTAAGTLNGLHTTVAGNLYAMQIAGNSSNIAAGGGVTITLTEALQEGDVIRVTGFQDKNASDKETALYMSFDQDATNKGNISDTENWVNLNTTEGCATGSEPETKIYTVTAALAGSNKLTLIRTSGKTGTNLFINKFQIYRNPTVNADINFSNAISDGAVAGTKNSMALSNTSGNQPFELGYTSGTPATTVLGDVLRVGNGTGTVTIADSELAGAKDIVVISFDMYFGKYSGKSAGFYLYDGSDGVIGGFYRNFYNGTTGTNTFGFDVSEINSVGDSKNQNDKICIDANKTTFEIHLDYSTGKMYAIQSTNGTVKQKTTPVAMGSSNSIKKFVVTSNYNNDDRRCWFDNLKIQTYAGDYGSTKTITLNFKDGENNDISGLYTGTTEFVVDAGETFTPSDYYPVAMYDGDYKYSYTSGGDAFVVTTDQEVNLVYTKSARPTHTVTVTANYGGKNKTIVNGVSVKEATDYTYYYPRHILDGTTLYVYASSTDAGASDTYWISTTTVGTENVSYTLTYNAVSGECVYYSEGEDIPSKTDNYSHYASVSSNGTTGVLNNAEGNLVTSLAAGKYTITARTVGRGDGNRNIFVYKSSVDDANKLLTCTPAYTGNTQTSEAFELTAETNILVNNAPGGGQSGRGLDYIYIMKTGEVLTSSAELQGYKTFYNATTNYEADENTTIYKAAAPSDGKVVLTDVGGNKIIKAGEAVILKTTNTTNYTLVLTATETASTGDFDGNALQVAAGTESNKYVLGYTSANGFGFYYYTALLPAGYIFLDGAAPNPGVKLFSVVADGTATGVETPEVAEAEEEEVLYNTAGVRVGKDYKGIVINQKGEKRLQK